MIDRRPILVVMAALFLLTEVARSQTKMVDTKTAAKPEGTGPRKILVLAVTDDVITRATFEDVIAGELEMRGATAKASHLPFPDLPKERGPFEAKLAEMGYDGVLVGRLVGSQDKIKVKEGYTSYATDYQGMDWWGGYWYTYQQVFVPGYLDKETKVRLRADLWRASDNKTGQLVWSGTSETLNPRTAAQAAHEVGNTIVNALVKAKLL